MTTEISSQVEERSLVPLGGALVAGSAYTYKIDLVATEKFGSRPWYQFMSEQVLVDEKTGVLRFNARPNDLSQFIFNCVFVKSGKGDLRGMFVNIYVQAYRKTKKFATAELEGHIITCNNVGPAIGYVIEVQAKSEIEIKYYD